ncbi:Septal ring factor EnvC, activator of murein hydrolases AmiA and AmiB [Daejeonella lutea]|uniref:Septal ring factor EnvC, activator of murein hydrolases AmiA and AmiB n=2 Tax=Daejeonella lutea TaxID=572036 RepID=A0A1T5B6L9_9SPHI|nr:Septal ring factor EnvC, activator of murein hydrolases AmiA and AmiB [Daejeonella lutea]
MAAYSSIVDSFAAHNNTMPLLRFITFLLLILSVQTSYGQSSAELKKRKDAINREIESLKKTRSKIDKNKKLSLSQITLLNAQIKLREEKIGTINSEIKMLDNKISTNTSEVKALQSDLSRLKKEYAKMILFAFRNQGAYNKMMFVFAAKDFNQAYMRLKYIQQVGKFRKSQAKYIETTQVTLKKQISILDENKRQKSDLLSDQLNEKQTLGKDKNEQSKILNNLTKQEKTLQAQLAKKQKEASSLNNAIQAAIRKEILAAQRRAAEKARLAEQARQAKLAAAAKAKATTTAKTPTPAAATKPAVKPASGSSVLASSPEDAKLSSSFMGNRGRLQKPAQGIVTQGFGQYKYKSNVTLFNPGINIKTAAGATVYAIFEGQVSQVFMVLNNYAVMVRHGEYFTIYSKLRSVSVSAGQKVSTRQAIGTVANDPSDGISEMQFQIWKGTKPVDPSGWVR